jgi:hypothetical protein
MIVPMHIMYTLHGYRLQLLLIAASREVILIQQFFLKLCFIVKIIGASSKRNDKLQAAQAIDINNLIAIDELETGKGINQIVLILE